MAVIAFFTLNAYDMLTGGHEGDAVGGAQLQQILVGKELSRRGHEVIFVEYDGDSKTEDTVDEIEVVTKPRPSGSEPVRAIEAFSGTFRTLRRINPDICYRRVLNFELLPLSLYCSITGTRFVYGVAHDDELTDDPHMFSEGIKSSRIYKWLNRYVLSNADAVIAQNSHQYEIATRRLETDVYQVPNCYRPRDVKPIEWEYEPPVVFWAARYQPWKNPEIVAQLAEQLPDITFVMAGGPGDEALYTKIERRAESLENLHLLGHVPFTEIDRYFAAADLFLNTSDTEGFPNTFLQAWAYETPIASLTVDPNGILSEHGVGVVARGSIETLCDQVRELTTDNDRLQILGNAGSEYLHEHHTIDVIVDQYESVLLDNE